MFVKIIIEKVFPAWAGMNRIVDIQDERNVGVPRVGGDEPVLH